MKAFIIAAFVAMLLAFCAAAPAVAAPGMQLCDNGTPPVCALVDAAGGIAQALYPVGASPLTASSGNVANSAAVATLAGASGKTTYITGFQCTGTGATIGLPVVIAVTGTITGTMSYITSAIAGALLLNTPLNVAFAYPVPASATNTAIVVTMPALGTGNTNAVCTAQGFRV